MNIPCKPHWIKVKALSEISYKEIISISSKYSLNTVCQEAKCPNINECWSARTATFLLMGKICTRNCLFCDVKSGNPKGYLDRNEPINIARAINELNLKHAVLTSVSRDDLNDGGSRHYEESIREIKKLNSKVIIEALIPDFRVNKNSLNNIIQAKPAVISHNIETVERLSPIVRDKRANYGNSLNILGFIKEINPEIITKSSLLVGLGETDKEIEKSLTHLREHNVDIVVIGQYLRPGEKQLEVKDYIKLDKFKEYEAFAKDSGFLYVISDPLARSSYKAEEAYNNIRGEIV